MKQWSIFEYSPDKVSLTKCPNCSTKYPLLLRLSPPINSNQHHHFPLDNIIYFCQECKMILYLIKSDPILRDVIQGYIQAEYHPEHWKDVKRYIEDSLLTSEW